MLIYVLMLNLKPTREGRVRPHFFLGGVSFLGQPVYIFLRSEKRSISTTPIGNSELWLQKSRAAERV